MPEPITIVAGVMSILASTLTSAKEIYMWVDGLQNAPGQIHDISQTVKVFEKVLLRLQAIQFDSGDRNEILSVIEASRNILSKMME